MSNNTNIKDLGLLGNMEVVTDFPLSFARKGCNCFFVPPRCCQRKSWKTFSYLKFLHRQRNAVSLQHFAHELHVGWHCNESASIEGSYSLSHTLTGQTSQQCEWELQEQLRKNNAGVSHGFCTHADLTPVQRELLGTYLPWDSLLIRVSFRGEAHCYPVIRNTVFGSQKPQIVFSGFILLPATYIYVL